MVVFFTADNFAVVYSRADKLKVGGCETTFFYTFANERSITSFPCSHVHQ